MSGALAVCIGCPGSKQLGRRRREHPSSVGPVVLGLLETENDAIGWQLHCGTVHSTYFLGGSRSLLSFVISQI